MRIGISPEAITGITNLGGRAIQVGGGTGMIISTVLTEAGQTIIENANPELARTVADLLVQTPLIERIQDHPAVPFGLAGAGLIALGELIIDRARG